VAPYFSNMSIRNTLVDRHFSVEQNSDISTEDIREQLSDAVFKSIEEQQNVVHQAPTSIGKTHLIATTQWSQYDEITGDQPVFHLLPTRKARDEAYQLNQQSDATGLKLRGRQDACGLAAGEYDNDIDAPDGSTPSKWFEKKCDQQGWPFSIAHLEFDQRIHRQLPCRPCDAIQQWDELKKINQGESETDVIFATHDFARSPKVHQDANLVFDERPDFKQDFDVDDIRVPITSYLKAIDAPVEDYESLISNYLREPQNQSFRRKFDRPDREWFIEKENSHVLAPGIAQAILSAEERANDRWVGEVWYQYPNLNPYTESLQYPVQISVVFDEKNNLRKSYSVPKFAEARSVIGLDAHPAKSKWKINLNNIESNSILTAKETQNWRKEERNLRIYQIGNNKHTWTVQGYERAENKVDALCSELREKHGEQFRSGIISKKYELDFKKLLEENGVNEPLVTHYGMEESVNEFEDEEVGLVLGCISPNDDDIKDWIALLDKEAKPLREADNPELNPSSGGQIWVGSNRDIAHELIFDIRERHVLQAVGRFARSPSDFDDGATVYVFTNVLPDQWVDREIADVDILTEKQLEMLEIIADSEDGMTASEVADEIDVTERYVYDLVEHHRGTEWLNVIEGAGSYNADVFEVDRVPKGVIEL